MIDYSESRSKKISIRLRPSEYSILKKRANTVSVSSFCYTLIKKKELENLEGAKTSVPDFDPELINLISIVSQDLEALRSLAEHAKSANGLGAETLQAGINLINENVIKMLNLRQNVS